MFQPEQVSTEHRFKRSFHICGPDSGLNKHVAAIVHTHTSVVSWHTSHMTPLRSVERPLKLNVCSARTITISVALKTSMERRDRGRPLVAGEAAAHRGRLIALSIEAMTDERSGLEGRDDSPRMAARVGGAEAASIRAETTLCANATLALGAAEPEVGACGERRVEMTYQVRAERGRHEPFT